MRSIPVSKNNVCSSSIIFDHLRCCGWYDITSTLVGSKIIKLLFSLFFFFSSSSSIFLFALLVGVLLLRDGGPAVTGGVRWSSGVDGAFSPPLPFCSPLSFLFFFSSSSSFSFTFSLSSCFFFFTSSSSSRVVLVPTRRTPWIEK